MVHGVTKRVTYEWATEQPEKKTSGNSTSISALWPYPGASSWADDYPASGHRRWVKWFSRRKCTARALISGWLSPQPEAGFPGLHTRPATASSPAASGQAASLVIPSRFSVMSFKAVVAAVSVTWLSPQFRQMLGLNKGILQFPCRTGHWNVADHSFSKLLCLHAAAVHAFCSWHRSHDSSAFVCLAVQSAWELKEPIGHLTRHLTQDFCPESVTCCKHILPCARAWSACARS